MVVDDDQAIRRLVRDYLQGFGHEVVLADSGEAALEIFRVYQPAVSAVLTDIMMPGMSGIELADRLHQIKPTLAIVFMSSHIQIGQLGGCTVLHKPFSLEELKQAIEGVLLRGEGNDGES